MGELQTVMVRVEDLMPYENNAKIHTDTKIEHIRRSIRDFGFCDPVGVWTNKDGKTEIVTGHGAVVAAKLEGIGEVPCNHLDHLTDDERREYCHVHNQTQLETGMDYERLVADMDTLPLDWDSFGFERYTYSLIDDLMKEDFFANSGGEKETFNITFTFPAEHRDKIEAYIEEVGKQSIVDEIVGKAV